ncbi:MAG: hypothetical protein WAV47_07555 [Blastocatellia bacterium]
MPYVSFDQMIPGFNTDVAYEGHVYHVQTEDRGNANPILESLVYVGGTIVAKKLTPYSDQLIDGATSETIASLLKRQHQVVIAAIKAGRIEDLIRHTQKSVNESRKKLSSATPVNSLKERPAGPSKTRADRAAPTSPTSIAPPHTPRSVRNSGALKTNSKASSGRGDTSGLNLDAVVADYMKRSSDETRLDVKVLTPEVFTAGKSVGLRVGVARDSKPDFDATVTVKIIGTAFKPQVFIGRVGRDGVANFSLSLPSFTTGTAAIVIEAQSGTGRGELKKLIRRA